MRARLTGVLCCAALLLGAAWAQQDGGKTFDHSRWARVLKHYARDGWVDYARLKRSPQTLDLYLLDLARADMSGLDRNEKIALYINAYNAFTVKLILEYYPDIKSIKDISRFKRWQPSRWSIGGRFYSLDEVENDVLRKQFGEPRVHFALVCASLGCPDLRGEMYVGARLDEQLDAAARRFLASPKGLRVDRRSGTLHLSSIFKWYKDDFAAAAGDVPSYVARYADAPAAAWIRARKADLRVRYMDYDWHLNDVKNRPEGGPPLP